MQATDAANAMLPILTSAIASRFGDELVGLYLFGSLISGDFLPGVSDIDLLAVITRDLNDADVAPLAALHAGIVRDHPEWDDRIEVAYLSADGLRDFRSRISPLIIISPGEPLHLIDAGPDWLMNWYLVRSAGIALAGPPPRDLIPPIATAEYHQTVQEHLSSAENWIARATSRKPGSYAVLTAGRGLYTLRIGEHASKAQTAAWMQAQFPEWADLIDCALAWRGMPEDQELTAEDRAEIARYLSIVTAAIRSDSD